MRRLTVVLLLAACAAVGQKLPNRSDWKADLAKTSINLGELISDGPEKDSVPAIQTPKFVSVEASQPWLADQEPVIVVSIGGVTRIYFPGRCPPDCGED